MADRRLFFAHDLGKSSAQFQDYLRDLQPMQDYLREIQDQYERLGLGRSLPELYSPYSWGPDLARLAEGASREEGGIEAENRLAKELDRLSSRHDMLLSLMGEEAISSRLQQLFPKSLTRVKYTISFECQADATIGEYSAFLGSLDRLYRLLLTFSGVEYFTQRWLVGRRPTIAEAHLFTVTSFVKKSPGEIQGSSVGEVARSLGEVLSLGKQVEALRMSGVNVEKAKLELEQKKQEVEAARADSAAREKLKGLEAEVERAKLELELEKLRTQRDEEVRKRRKLLLEDLDQRVEMLSKGMSVLDEIPEEIQEDFKAALQVELEALRGSPIAITGFATAPLIAENSEDTGDRLPGAESRD